MKKIIIPFKGDRTYVQGPDLYNVMVGMFEEKKVHDIHFSAHTFVRKTNCVLYVVDDLSEMRDRLPMPAQFWCKVGGRKQYVFLEEDADQINTPQRIDFDESRILQLCTIDDTVISMAGKSPYSFIETVVSMKKDLLNHSFPDADGQWIFNRIDLPRRFEERFELKVEMQHNMGFKLIKSGLFHKMKAIGHLYFSLVAT